MTALLVGCVSRNTRQNWEDHLNAASLRGLCVLCAQVKQGMECRLRRSHQQERTLAVLVVGAMSRVPEDGALSCAATTAGTQACVRRPAEFGRPHLGPELPKRGAPLEKLKMSNSTHTCL